MNWKRVFRVLVCFVLVCCLFINVMAVQARALVLDWALLPVAATLVVAGSMAGLFGDSAAQVLTNSVEDCIDFLTLNYNFVTDEEKIEIWSTGNPDLPYMVDQSLLDAIREWFFQNYSVDTETGDVYAKSEVEIPEGYASFNGTVLKTSNALTDYAYSFIVYRNDFGCYYWYHTETVPYWDTSSTYARYVCDNGWRYYKGDGTSWTYGGRTLSSVGAFRFYEDGTTLIEDMTFIWADHDISYPSGNLFFPGTSPITSEGEYIYTTAGVIASSDDDLPTGYPVWTAGSVTIPGTTTDDDTVAYPIGIGQTLEDTLALTQADVWQGVSTYSDSGGDLENPDDNNDENTTGLTFGDITVTAFLGKLLADITKLLFGSETSNMTLAELWGSKWIELQSMFNQMQNALIQALSDIGSFIQSLPQSFSEFFTQNLEALQAHFSNLTSSLESWFSQLKESQQMNFSSLTQSLTSLFVDLKTELLQGIKSLFLPEENYITEKMNDLCDKYTFAASIADTGNELKFWLTNLGQQPPIIYIDLSATRGPYDIGGKVPLIDLTWYSEYKSTVDGILSAFLWLWFVWRMLLSLPGIIQGTSGFWNKTDPEVGKETWHDPVRWEPRPRGLLGTSEYLHKDSGRDVL